MPRFASVLTFVLVAFLLVAPVARAGAWQRPVDGSVLRAFALGRDPHGAGWHRGVDLAAARGSPVRSACAGRVSFAGRVPRGGLTVSVRCEAIVATYQQLGSVAIRRGRVVERGVRLGSVGTSSDPRERRPHLHLGAREAATGRYLDPLELLGGAGSAPLLLPPAAAGARPRRAPLGPAPLSPRIGPVRVSRKLPRFAPAGPVEGVPRGFESHVPWIVWIGLACAGLALPIGGLARVRRRERAARRVERTA